jgi:RHS repeat-associated protein
LRDSRDAKQCSVAPRKHAPHTHAESARSNSAFEWELPAAYDDSYTVNGLNQYTSAAGASPTYDTRGNLTNDGSTTYGFDYDNRLTSATGGVSLQYDPVGRLHEVDGAATTRFLYDGTDMIAEYNTSGTVLRRYVHGAGVDEPLVWYEGSDTSDRRYLMADERGSVIGVTNNSGAVTQVNTYDAYGVPDSANDGQFQYTGQMWLEDVGVYHYKARVYDPELGRFLQTDPIGTAGGMNLYGYVGSDPVNRVDPNGLCANEFQWWSTYPKVDRLTWLTGNVTFVGSRQSLCVDDFLGDPRVLDDVATYLAATEPPGSSLGPQGEIKACTRASVFGAKISLGAQVGFSVRGSRLVSISGDINLYSRSQSSDEYFSRGEQSFGGGASIFGWGPSVASIRSVPNIGNTSLSDASWEGPTFSFKRRSPIPNVSPKISAPDGDGYLGAGVKVLAGLELQLNLSELYRRTFGDDACQ